VQHYKLQDCQAAIERITEDRPITVKDDKGNQPKLIVDITSLFITLEDHIQLNMASVEELLPDLKALVQSLNRLSSLPESYEGKRITAQWLTTLKGMNISDDLADDQKRQLSFDLQAAFDEFRDFIESQ